MTEARLIVERCRRLFGSTTGAAAVEMAILLPVFAAMVLGFLDFSYTAYVRSTANGALEQVARAAGVGADTVDPRTAELKVEATIRDIAKDATFNWEKKSYYEFSGVNKPEKLTSDKNGNKKYDAGDCWEDLVDNNKYDTSPGRDGIGTADDVVFYKLQVSFAPLVKLSGLLPSIPDTRSVTAATIIKRQPYAAQTVPAIRC